MINVSPIKNTFYEGQPTQMRCMACEGIAKFTIEVTDTLNFKHKTHLCFECLGELSHKSVAVVAENLPKEEMIEHIRKQAVKDATSRYNARTILAMEFSFDSSELREYQYHAGRTDKPVYAIGNAYYCATKIGQKPAKHREGMEWLWQTYNSSFAKNQGYQIWIAQTD
jgi:hypothetical protein